MSAEEAQFSGASSFTSRLDSSPWLRSVAMKDENKSRGVKGEREEMDGTEKWNSKSLAATAMTGSTDVSEESEPESPPPIVRRKVSFADAFGLDLVSVKEFRSKDQEGKVEDFLCGLDTDEYYLSCLFTPPSPDVLLEKVEEKKVAMAAIELLPGTTTVRGTVRVANLCFQKAVYVRTTFDCWANYFDLLAEYIPGSSTGDTDDFTFRLTMVPPFEPEGLRVEFCLRYETAAGNFWESNNGMNYVLYCRKRDHGGIEEKGTKSVKNKEKETKPKGKRSCLKASGKKIQPEAYAAEAMEEIPDSVSHKAAHKATRKAVDYTDRYASEECLQKTLVDSRRSRRRARIANVKDYFAQKETEAQLGHFGGEKNSHPSLTPEYKEETWSNATATTELLRNEYANTGADKGQVLTYHEIPLQSLSWDRNSVQENITRIPGHQDLCNGAILEHQSETTQNEFDISTQGVHHSVSKNNTINAVEELNSHSQPQSSLDQSGSAVQPAGISELVQVQTETEASVQDIFRPRSSTHVTAASSSSSMEEAQESARHVIGDPECDAQEGNPALSRAGRRSEFECVSRAASLADYELKALEPDDHKALHRLSSPDQSPLTQGSHGLKQVTSQARVRSGEAESEAMSSEEVTAWATLAPAVQPATLPTTAGTAQTAEHKVPQAPARVPPQESAQSSAEITPEAMASMETIRKTAAESTVMALGQIEGEMTAIARVIDANKAHAMEPATTQVPSLLKPQDMIAGVSSGPWEGESKGGCELSVNTMAKVGGGGESQDHVSPTTGETVTFTDADEEVVCERAHPMRPWEEVEEEEEEEMVVKSREGRGEHPFKILNEREESGEAKRDTIGEEEGDSSQEMSRFKEPVSVVFETDRLECTVSNERRRRRDHDVEDWKDEMEKCLGVGREQGSISEPVLYEQFTKATRGHQRIEHQRKSDSEMLSEAFERMLEERCPTGDDSPAPADSVWSGEEEQGNAMLAQGSEELLDVSPNVCIEGGSNDSMPVHSVITLLDEQVTQDPHVPIPTPKQTLCSIQTTLGGRDPFLFHSDETSPVLQVGAATWSTCAISGPLGDGHEIEVVLRHRRSAQPAEHLQSPLEETEIHAQFPGIGASSSSSDVDSPAPLSLWLSGFCSSLGHMSRAALYAVLFAMFFLTAFVCDLPVCLAIYLFSLCWWWCHGERQPLPGSKGVD
ncbi:uncharacterized protein ppp1r3aa isoform X2 [Alosa sapidissima]|uniref:uncharacterized protein ppp1r3aa isoform X2 n=1 Tax=Alosa sapidissima TaxID=34773 RepID=UPI001C09479D|nr:uncharacterized protein ppp1r3aa isoform X2 [Alosa sapidissima]